MTRKLGRKPRHHDGTDEAQGNGRPIPTALIWLVLAVLVLVIVIVYDRRAISEAESRVVAGKQYETQGLYLEALEEYEQAFSNKRLGRKARAGAAVAMAEIHYNHLDDFPTAHRYYTEARKIAPVVLEEDSIKRNAKDASIKARQVGAFARPALPAEDGVATRTIVQRVSLIEEPAADIRGPVLADYDGGQVHAGQLLRALEKRPEFLEPDFREDPSRLKEFLQSVIREDLAYEAAVRAGIHKNPDVSQRLYDYQKTLITQRYMTDRRDRAMVVDSKDVDDYYRQNLSEYVQPGELTYALIKSDTESSAAQYLQMLRDGAAFQDVATSYSTHAESAANGGLVGTLKEKDTTIAGVENQSAIAEALFKLPVNSVTEVTRIEDAFYIFKIASVKPARNITLDEARPQIENIVRGRAVDKARQGLDSELIEEFAPEIDEDKLARFWDYVRAESSASPATTATSTTAASTGTTTSQENP